MSENKLKQSDLRTRSRAQETAPLQSGNENYRIQNSSYNRE